MIRIKVCGMRDEKNIREVAALRPDFMGFIFYPHSKRYYGTDYFHIRQVSEEIKKVGVFVDEKPDVMLKVASLCGLDFIQLHGSESEAICREMKSAGYRVIKVFPIDNEFDFTSLSEYSEVCDYFMFDRKTDGYGGSGIKFDWKILEMYDLSVPYFLSGGIGPGDDKSIVKIENPSLFAVDINSRFEIQPGLKNIQSIGSFIDSIRLMH